MSRNLAKDANKLKFGSKVAYVYNPLEYAAPVYETYLKTYGNSTKKVIFLGMNPGPFGMAQTGVPFGEVASVKNWLALQGKVGRPPKEHPKRPIQGFDCHRNEVSGARLWGLFSQKFKSPARFFKKHFVANYCPLIFMAEGGKNVPPSDLTKQEAEKLLNLCDDYLRQMVEIIQPQHLVGVGKYAMKRAQLALGETNLKISSVLHPSPASPQANRGWAEQAEAQLIELGIW